MFAVAHFFGFRQGGTFIELGALDGVTFSNTYLFEKCLGWRGILIEPSRKNFEQLKKNRPDQALLNAAICDSDSTLQFIENFAVGGIVEYMAPSFIQAWHPYLLHKDMLLKNVTVDGHKCTIWGPYENHVLGVDACRLGIWIPQQPAAWPTPSALPLLLFQARPGSNTS